MKDFINSDCNEILKTIPDKSINLFLEDMPYNTTACHWEYEVDLEQYWALRLPKLADKGCFVLTGSQPFTTDLIMSNRKMFKYELIWEKNRFTNFMNAKKMPMRNHENILIFYSTQPIFNPQLRMVHGRGHSSNYKSTKIHNISGKASLSYSSKREPGLGMSGSVIFIPSETEVYNSSNGKQGRHPTQKPVDLFRYMIKMHTNKGDTVFDGYAGSGTTAIACEIEDRNYICVEMDKDYFDAASKRLANHKSQLRIF